MFPEGGAFVSITDSEGGPTATGMIPEGSTTKKSCHPPPPHRLINGTALTNSNFPSLSCHFFKSLHTFVSVVHLNEFFKFVIYLNWKDSAIGT